MANEIKCEFIKIKINNDTKYREIVDIEYIRTPFEVNFKINM